MGKEKSKVPNKLSSSQLLKFLDCPGKVCISGYDLSQKANAPDFNDILKGVWSHPSSKLNPFNSNAGRQIVCNWFGCRTQMICKSGNPGVFKHLASFQERFNMIVVSQCVDGMAHENGVHDVLEPYGNVFGRICLECGHIEAPSQTDQSVEKPISTCGHCGGSLYPDVSMFGWNQKEECRQKVQAIIKASTGLILIGADPALLPFYGSTTHEQPDCLVLEITPSGFLLNMPAAMLKATAKDIAKDFEEACGQKLNVPDKSGVDDNLRLLLTISNPK